MSKWLRITASSLLAIVLVLTTVYATTGTASAAALLELKIKKGSTSATINGQKQTIVKPYESNGITMVQLGLFTRAFKAQVKLQENDSIKLMYGKRTLSMTIGSKKAYLNGSTFTLDAAPVMKSGILMVPVRSVAKSIGAKFKVVSGQMIITVAPATTDSGTDKSTHVGKTKIGSSKYQWSINYPSDLTNLGLQDGKNAAFMDNEAKYYLQIFVDPEIVMVGQGSESDLQDLLDELVSSAQDAGEMIVDQKVVNSSKGNYAYITSKDSDGILSQTRVYTGNGHVYYVMYADSEATSYKDFTKAKVTSLLNSFKTSFNSADKAMEDLASKEEDTGTGKTLEASEYGVYMELPADFEASESSVDASAKDGSYVAVNVYSAPAGSTLAEWLQKIQGWFADNFNSDAYRNLGSEQKEIAGQTATVNKLEYTFGDTWMTEYEVLFQKDGYRYYMEYSTPSDKASKDADFQVMIDSLEIDFPTLEENFGSLPVDYYSQDRSKVATHTSEANHYSVQVPRHWTSTDNDFESSYVYFSHTGGSFNISTKTTSSLEKAVTQWKATFEGSGDNNVYGVELSEGTPTTFAGVPAYTFTANYPDATHPYTGTYTIFTKGKMTYILGDEVNNTNNTPVHQADLAKILASFQLTS